MAEKVEIIVTAKDSASQVLRGVAGSFGSIGSAVQMLTSGGALEALTDAIVKFGRESVDATVAYANEVRQLSQISGQSAEETSRLIQLSDDYKISTGDLTMAVRKLANDGLTLNVETLAKLSDEYNKLAPGQERASFLMEKFGRTGVRFAEIMEQGGDSIRQMNGEIDANLVLTDKAVLNARKYEQAMDSWEEQTMKLQYALGNKLLPALTSTLNEANKRIGDNTVFDAKRMIPVYGAWLQLTEIWKTGKGILSGLSDETDSATQSYTAYAQAIEATIAPTQAATISEEEQAAALEAEAEAAKKASESYSSMLSLIQNVAGATKDYQTSLSDLQAERADVAAKLAETPIWDTKEIEAHKEKLGEIDDKIAETAEKYKIAGADIIYSNFLSKLSVDGLTDAEFEMAQKAGVSLGLWSQQDADLAVAMNDLTTKVADGKLGIDAFGAAINALPSGKTIDVIANLMANAAAQGPAMNAPGGGGAAPGSGQQRNRAPEARAAGGPVSAGQWYRVNETAQEYFKPSTGGQVMPIAPNGGAGGGVTVIIQAQNVIGDSAHLQSYLLPVIRDGLKQVQAGR